MSSSYTERFGSLPLTVQLELWPIVTFPPLCQHAYVHSASNRSTWHARSAHGLHGATHRAGRATSRTLSRNLHRPQRSGSLTGFDPLTRSNADMVINIFQIVLCFSSSVQTHLVLFEQFALSNRYACCPESTNRSRCILF